MTKEHTEKQLFEINKALAIARLILDQSIAINNALSNFEGLSLEYALRNIDSSFAIHKSLIQSTMYQEGIE